MADLHNPNQMTIVIDDNSCASETFSAALKWRFLRGQLADQLEETTMHRKRNARPTPPYKLHAHPQRLRHNNN